MNDLDDILWPCREVGRLLPLLADIAGLGVRSQSAMKSEVSSDAADEWIQSAGQILGVEIVREDLRHQHVDAFVRTGAPALIRVDSDAAFIGLVNSGRRSATVLSRSGKLRSIHPATLSKLIRRAKEGQHATDIDTMLTEATIASSRRDRARTFLLGERLAFQPVARAWRLERPATAGLLRHLRDARLHRSVAGFAALYGLHYALLIMAWALVGKWGLEGHPQAGWTTAWLLLMVTMVPLQLLAAWTQGIISLRAGSVLKRLLLSGILKSDPDVMRASGPSEHLGPCSKPARWSR